MEQEPVKRAVVLGAGGMAGHVMAAYLEKKAEYTIFRCARNAITPDTIILDVTEFPKVKNVLAEWRPDVVINCVGLLIQASQERLDEAILINSYLPHFLSKLGREIGFRLIHISTDCVFSGAKGSYTETDFRDGDTPYARSKALGEVINDRDLTLRTSIIGPELKNNGTGLLHWFLTQTGEIAGYRNTYWSGVTTLELVKVVDHCIRHEITGLLNLGVSPKISKYNLLLECQRVWGHNRIKIVPEEAHARDKSLITQRAEFGLPRLASYPAMLVQLFHFMQDHREWYSHYPQIAPR